MLMHEMVSCLLYRSTGRRSERGFVWLTIRAQYAEFVEYAGNAILLCCQADGVTLSRGSLGSQHSVGSSSSSHACVCHACVSVCICFPLCLMRARLLLRTWSFVVSVPIWLKLLFVHVVLVC